MADDEVSESRSNVIGGKRRSDDRLVRLLCLAYCLKIRHLLDDERSLKAMDVLERLADGRAELPELSEAAKGAIAAVRGPSDTSPAGYAASAVARAVAWSILFVEGVENDHADSSMGVGVAPLLGAIDAWNLASFARAEALHPGRGKETWQLEADALKPLLPDIFPQPKKERPIDRAWCTPTVVDLARAIDETGCFDGMPALGDALEEAGCDSDEVLAHCREPGSLHARGCWVVDGILEQG